MSPFAIEWNTALNPNRSFSDALNEIDYNLIKKNSIYFYNETKKTFESPDKDLCSRIDHSMQQERRMSTMMMITLKRRTQ